MRKFYKVDEVRTNKAEALPRPLSAQLRKPAGLLKQRILAEQQKQGAATATAWQQRKAELLAALRPTGERVGPARTGTSAGSSTQRAAILARRFLMRA